MSRPRHPSTSIRQSRCDARRFPDSEMNLFAAGSRPTGKTELQQVHSVVRPVDFALNGVRRHFASLLCVLPAPRYILSKGLRFPSARPKLCYGFLFTLVSQLRNGSRSVLVGHLCHTIKIYEPCACASSQAHSFYQRRRSVRKSGINFKCATT